MSVLMWDQPEQVMPKEEYANISADGAPPGVYAGNMSEADKKRWRAKMYYKRTDDPRVEIRTSVAGSKLLLVVRPKRNIRMSMNGPCRFDWQRWQDMSIAIEEALTVLENSLYEEERRNDNSKRT